MSFRAAQVTRRRKLCLVPAWREDTAASAGCSPTLLASADKAPVLLGTGRHVMLPVPPSELLNFITGSQEYFPTNNFPYEPLWPLSQGWAAGDWEEC